MSLTRPLWACSRPAALLLLAPFDVLASLAMDIYLPVVPAMPGLLDTSPFVIQLTLTLYMLMLGAGQIVFGPMSDRMGRRPVLLSGTLVFIAASVGAAMASTGTAFVALRLLQGAGAAAMLVATFATVRDVYADHPDGAVIYGLLSAILAFVPAAGPLAGALIDRAWGWRAIFITLAALAAPVLLHAFLRWPETLRRAGAGSQVHGSSMKTVLSSPEFWVYTGAFAAAMGSFFVFFSTAPRVLVGRAGYTTGGFSMAFATVALVMIVATRFIPRAVAKWGIAGCVARGMTLLGCGAVLVAGGEALAPASFIGFIMPMWLMAVGIVLTTSVTANGALKRHGDRAGAAVALYFFVQSLMVGMAGSLAVVTLNGDTGWPLACYALVMTTLVTTGLTLLRRRRTAGDSPSTAS